MQFELLGLLTICEVTSLASTSEPMIIKNVETAIPEPRHGHTADFGGDLDAKLAVSSPN